MKHAVNGEVKEHYKAYKAGKHWIYACITVVAIGFGLTGVSTGTAQAATSDEDAAPAGQVVQQPVTGNEATSNVTDNQEAPSKQDEHVAGSVDKDVNDQNNPASNGESEGVSGDDVQGKDGQNNDVKPVEQKTTQPKSVDTEKTGEQPENKPAESVNDQVKPIDKTAEGAGKVAVKPTKDLNPTIPAVKKQVFMMARMAAAPVLSGPKELPIVSVDRAPGFMENIYGKDASEWMPDSNLRQALEASINSMYTLHGQYAVTDENLYTFAGYAGDSYYSHGINLSQEPTDGPITSLEGLQYFTNLRQFSIADAQLPLSGMIDFSFAPNLTNFTLFNVDNIDTDWGTTADAVIQNYFSKNHNLQYLNLSNVKLRGSFPDLHALPELYMVVLPDNDLTGTLPDLSYLKALWELNVNNNQMSGQLPDISNWSMTNLRISDNQFSGVLPNTSHLDSLEYSTNKISTAIIPGSYQPGAFVYSTGQTLENGHHALTNAQDSFDPTEGVFKNFMNFTTGETVDSVKMVPGKFKNGELVVYAIDSPENVTDHNTWSENQVDASSWFKVLPNPQNPDGFLLVGTPAAKNGNYVIKVVLADGASNDATAWVNFSVTNNMTPVTPGKPDTTTPDTTDPDTKLGSVTIVSVDQNGKVLSTVVKTGTVGDTYSIDAPNVPGFQATGKTNATGTYTAAGQTITFTYDELKSSGDGATITGPKVDKVTKSGAADKVAGQQQGQTKQATRKGQPVNLKTGAQAVRQSANRVAKVTPMAAKKNAQASTARTTLPQTDETNSGSYILAGIATLVGALGLAGMKLRKHE